VPNKLQVEYVSIDEIKTYENNAKLHPAEQIEQIKESIKEFGFNDPIAIDKDNVIIEGHGRYIACKELGITEVPIIRLNELSDEQKRAYMLVHNKLTMNTDFDIELLNDELENIFDIDMSKFDFDLGEDEEKENDITEPTFNYKEQYGVIVMCKNEVEQEEIYNRLTEEGYECKVVAV
jgi:ParB-like chromosome segregation protein Spo0J